LLPNYNGPDPGGHCDPPAVKVGGGMETGVALPCGFKSPLVHHLDG
jgi:hypothetical protein